MTASARFGRLACLLTALITLSACAGALSVGIERTPTPDPAPAATLVALQAEVDRLNAALATAVAPPTGVPATLGRVAYIKGGDLWYTTLPAGPHQRLTIDGYNREPLWSPSGEWLAYRKDRAVLLERETPCREPLRQGEAPCKETVSTFQEQVWTMRRSGESSRVINRGLTVTHFAWSPQLDRLAYVTEQGHLEVLDPVSETTYRLVSAENNAGVGRIAWSPDGLRVAYEWATIEDAPESAPRTDGVFVVDAAGGSPVLVVRGVRSPATLAGWAGPDALFWQQADRASQPENSAWLYSALAPLGPDATASTPRLLTPEPMLPVPDFVAVGPESKEWPVAFVTGVGPATWTNKRLATGTFRTPSSVAAIAPAWAPDGARLAYVAMPDAPGLALGPSASEALLARRIWTAAPAAGAMRQLTNDERFRDERPQWSALSTDILFARITSQGQTSLWLIGAGGGEPLLVVDELTPAPDPIGDYGYIDWSQHYDWWRG